MGETLANMRRREEDDRGFTMIELLVVVVIIGVLVAIAVPVYLNYRKGAANKSAASDVRGAVTAIEQYYTENGNVYPDDFTGTKATNQTLAKKSGGTDQTITVSPGNTLQYKNNTSSYVICAQNDVGLLIYVYNSSVGGSVKTSTQADLATCVANGN